MALQFTGATKDGDIVALCGNSWRDTVADTILRNNVDHLRPSCA